MVNTLPGSRKAAALLYEANTTAPRVVASGSGYVAKAILERAEQYQVPVKIQPELVELLVQLDLNSLIPPQLYGAVVEVLAWAYQVDERGREPV